MGLLYPSPGIMPQGLRQPIQFPVAPYIYIGARRLAGYKGACMDVQPVGGGTAKTIGFTANTHVADWRAAANKVGTRGLISKLYDQSGNMDMTGTFMPIYGLNRIFGELPLVGALLGNGRDRGLIGVTYKLSGNARRPVLQINPLSVIAPGTFRSIFEFH